jgi:deoxyribonuclease-4
MDRNLALSLAAQTLKMAIEEADKCGLGHINICPETMGKINQLGDLNEILELCLIDERLIPTLDFGHIHVRRMGCLNKAEDFEQVLNQVENKLGHERLSRIHCHFSRIEFTAGGEKKHWTLDDTQYGPEFDILAPVIYKMKISPVIICESRGTMAEDALKLKRIYESVKE